MCIKTSQSYDFCCCQYKCLVLPEQAESWPRSALCPPLESTLVRTPGAEKACCHQPWNTHPRLGSLLREWESSNPHCVARSSAQFSSLTMWCNLSLVLANPFVHSWGICYPQPSEQTFHLHLHRREGLKHMEGWSLSVIPQQGKKATPRASAIIHLTESVSFLTKQNNKNQNHVLSISRVIPLVRYKASSQNQKKMFWHTMCSVFTVCLKQQPGQMS